ncbi:MAG: nitrous oxide-stimulated promoter family protein [Muribaculaceae bacterium]|nr:nitrous oxide-stimulated promoter family protein [Muribaculaceae bacterium]
MTHIEREQRTVEQMIQIYCRHKEGNNELCPDCMALLEYARVRLSKCPFGDDKSSCRACTVHCYRTDMRERIKAVMRYAGPRMILYHPMAAFRHLLSPHGLFRNMKNHV